MYITYTISIFLCYIKKLFIYIIRLFISVFSSLENI
nr:ALPV-024 [Albatrosspox virus]